MLRQDLLLFVLSDRTKHQRSIFDLDLKDWRIVDLRVRPLKCCAGAVGTKSAAPTGAHPGAPTGAPTSAHPSAPTGAPTGASIGAPTGAFSQLLLHKSVVVLSTLSAATSLLTPSQVLVCVPCSSRCPAPSTPAQPVIGLAHRLPAARHRLLIKAQCVHRDFPTAGQLGLISDTRGRRVNARALAPEHSGMGGEIYVCVNGENGERPSRRDVRMDEPLEPPSR